MWQRFGRAQGSFCRVFKRVLTSIHDTGGVLMSPIHTEAFGRRTKARAFAPALHRPGWTSAGVLALLCSGVAWASLPRVTDVPRDEASQWQSLAIAPLSNGGGSGMRMETREAGEPG